MSQLTGTLQIVRIALSGCSCKGVAVAVDELWNVLGELKDVAIIYQLGNTDEILCQGWIVQYTGQTQSTVDQSICSVVHSICSVVQNTSQKYFNYKLQITNYIFKLYFILHLSQLVWKSSTKYKIHLAEVVKTLRTLGETAMTLSLVSMNWQEYFKNLITSPASANGVTRWVCCLLM